VSKEEKEQHLYEIGLKKKSPAPAITGHKATDKKVEKAMKVADSIKKTAAASAAAVKKASAKVEKKIEKQAQAKAESEADAEDDSEEGDDSEDGDDAEDDDVQQPIDGHHIQLTKTTSFIQTHAAATTSKKVHKEEPADASEPVVVPNLSWIKVPVGTGSASSDA